VALGGCPSGKRGIAAKRRNRRKTERFTRSVLYPETACEQAGKEELPQKGAKGAKGAKRKD
jgi:hypothetical protein